MKSFAAVPLFALYAATVAAVDCRKGVDYCGSSLLTRGDYKAQIAQSLTDANHTSWSGDNVLFTCVGGDQGNVQFKEGCPGGCKNGGLGNDTCR